MRSALTGADAFLRAVESRMSAMGQGPHFGLSFLRVGTGFEFSKFSRAVQLLAQTTSLATGRIRQRFLGIPFWEWESEQSAHFPIQVHGLDSDAAAVALERINSHEFFSLRFDVFPEPEGKTLIVASWRHLLLDGKGAELMLAEICRLSEDPDAKPLQNSWGPTQELRLPWKEALSRAEQFKDHFYANAKVPIGSLTCPSKKIGGARFHLERFSREEVERIKSRAKTLSKDLFFLPLFLGVSIRSHRQVWLKRGGEPASYQASCAVQLRKAGASGPIWQNHVSQLFFCLESAQTRSLEETIRRLQEQFSNLTKARMQVAFVLMTNLFRRMPLSWYLRFIERHSGGQLTSFFYSYTGKFLAGTRQIAGAAILDGWHVPSLPAPPGTGLFFSEFDDTLTVTFSWREGVLSDPERELLCRTLRRELLGE